MVTKINLEIKQIFKFNNWGRNCQIIFIQFSKYNFQLDDLERLCLYQYINNDNFLFFLPCTETEMFYFCDIPGDLSKYALNH